MPIDDQGTLFVQENYKELLKRLLKENKMFKHLVVR